jgi:hypothetical protein
MGRKELRHDGQDREGRDSSQDHAAIATKATELREGDRGDRQVDQQLRLAEAEVRAVTAMAIYRLLQNAPWGPDEIGRLASAYEQVLGALGLKKRSDPMTELVARKIIEIALTGVRDSGELAAMAIKELGPTSG